MEIGTFATLRVVARREIGVLLEWGENDPLFLPDEEQEWELHIGNEVVVFVTIDEHKTPFASMRLDDFLRHDATALRVNQKVELLIVGDGRMGYEAIIDEQHIGILYHNEVFQEYRYGDRTTGYIKKIRPDGKVDLMAQLRGSRGTPDLCQQILTELEVRKGFLPITDKSEPELIYDLFGVSKKKYKVAIGSLFKQRLVSLDDKGVRLL